MPSNQKQTPGRSKVPITQQFFGDLLVGKQQIRIVPSAVYDSKNPFTELKFYYGITNKVMISPLNFGEKDPIATICSKIKRR